MHDCNPLQPQWPTCTLCCLYLATEGDELRDILGTAASGIYVGRVQQVLQRHACSTATAQLLVPPSILTVKTDVCLKERPDNHVTIALPNCCMLKKAQTRTACTVPQGIERPP
jgi:hypothetical protein